MSAADRLEWDKSAPGEYVTITERDGEDYVFKVISVSDVPMTAA